MNDDDDILVPTEPQITSEIREERIAARTLRIQRRENAVKRLEQLNEENALQGTENLKEFVMLDDEISPVERQAAECAAAVEHLVADGDEQVTNIKIASDTREVNRRFDDYQKKKEILGKLEEEANLAEEKFQIISDQWAPILELTDPLEINDEMIKQREKCDELIAQKNNLIEDLKKELKIVDDIFFADLKKQMEDIKQLSERIDSLVQLMKNAYRTQLGLLESSVELERTTSSEYNQKRWDALYKRRDKEERENVEKKIEQIKEFQVKMDILKLEHRERFRATKIQLESKIQTLQQELQHLKATCLINSEKIDYNYQVLKRREEENLFVRSQQKRKLNKMQDTVNGLKRKIKNAQKDGVAEEIKANKEIARLQEVILDLQIKAEHFATVNERRYQQLWRMNKEKANNLLKCLIEMDKEINAKVLGKGNEVKSIKVDIMKQSDLPSYRRALRRIQLLKTPSCESLHSEESEPIVLDSKYLQARNRLMTSILKLIADQTGFLIEERLWPLLKKYGEVPSLICKLDNVFSALEVSSEESILILCEYFCKYAFCPTCKEHYSSQEIQVVKTDVEEIPTQPSSYRSDDCDIKLLPVPHSQFYLEPKLTSDDMVETTSVRLLADEVEEIFIDYNIAEVENKKAVEKKKSQLTVFCEKGHNLNISPAHVLAALEEFAASVTKANIEANRPTISKVQLAISRKLKSNDVASFWARYKEAVQPEKEKLWDGIYFALGKYLPILKERQQLNEEVTNLRKQNEELKSLLRGQFPNELPKSTLLEPIKRKL